MKRAVLSLAALWAVLAGPLWLVVTLGVCLFVANIVAAEDHDD